MHVSRIVIVVGIAVITVAAVAHAQSFDVKLGEWQFTMSGWTGSPGDLSKVPANMRPQIEARLKQPQTYKVCLTAKDLKDVNIGNPDDDDDDCKITSRKMTANSADIARTCGGDRPRTETMHYEATSRENMKGIVKVTSKTGPAEMTLTGKWIATACKED